MRQFVSPAFQVQRADGSQTGATYLRNLPRILSYRVRKLVVTSAGNVVVATYEIAASEVINGKQLRTGYAPRISVFVNGAKGWQIVGHANFNTAK